MQKSVLVTSIPPKIKRVGANGEMLGIEYMQSCVDSWIDSGFTPISVNSRREFATTPNHIKGVEYIFVDRDANAFVGKPLVYIQDMLRIGANRSEGFFVLTNADILLKGSKDIFESLSGICSGQFIAERRFDIPSTDCVSGVKFTDGYDFFAFNSEDILGYSDDGFVFGIPWWDHYLPLKMALAGFNKIEIAKPFVYHLEHDERWDPDLWRMFGSVFMRTISRDFGKAGREEHIKLLNYKIQYNEAIALNKTRLRTLISLANRYYIFRNYLHDKKLSNIARLNMRFMEQNQQYEHNITR